MKEKLTNNFGMKLLSLALAIFLWLLVVNVDDSYLVKSFADIPVEIINEEALTSANKAWNVVEGDKVTVTVKAKRSIMEKINKSDIKAVADLSKLSLTNAVPIDVTILRYSDQIKEKTLGKINTLKVNIEDIATEQFPVTIVTSGEAGEGFAIGSKTAAPNIVEVSGPKSLVRRVKEVNVSLSVAGFTETTKLQLEPEFYNYDGDKLDASRLSCSVEKVEVEIQVLKTKEIPLTINTTGKVKSGYGVASVNYEPKTVIVAGSNTALRGVNEIVIDDISIANLAADLEQNVDLNQYLPEGIILAQENSEVMITVKVEALIEKKISFSTDDIDLLNIGNNLNIRFSDSAERIEVTVRGLKQDVDSIKVDDLNPTVELEGLSAGSHKVWISFEALEGIQYVKRVRAEFELIDGSDNLNPTGD